MEIKIVKVETKHIDTLYKIHCEEMPEPDKMTKENFYSEFSLPTRKYFVAVSDEEILGYIGVLDTLEDYNIMGIAVTRKYARKGIGTKLIEFLKQEAKTNFVKTLSLEVDEKNTSAINFYKKMGFVLTNIRKKYYKNNDAYIMWYYL